MSLKRLSSSPIIQNIKSYLGHQINQIAAGEKFKRAMNVYEEFLGIKEVKKTQEMVLKSEGEFVSASKIRRDLQQELLDIQSQLKQVRQKIDSTHRGDEAYLSLITSEHQLIKAEMNTLSKLRLCQDEELALFTRFSQRLREAHEVERLRQEKTRYISLVLGTVGTTVGVVATSVNHWSKMRELVKIIELQNSSMRERMDSLAPPTQQIQATVSPPPSPVSKELATIATQTEEPFKKEQFTELIASTEENLQEVQLKLNTITNVVKIYAVIAIAVPLITSFLLSR